MRAFIKMREQLLNRAELVQRLADIEKGLLSHDAALRDLYQKIRPLRLSPPTPPRKQTNRRKSKLQRRMSIIDPAAPPMVVPPFKYGILY